MFPSPRVAPWFCSRLWCAIDGVDLVGCFLYTCWKCSKRNSKAPLQSKSMVTRSIRELDCHQGIATSSTWLICLFCFSAWYMRILMVYAQITGHAKCSSDLYNWSFHSSNNDCSAVLFWPQCSFPTCSAERIQFEKTIFLPLRFASFGVSGMQSQIALSSLSIFNFSKQLYITRLYNSRRL